MTDLALFIVGVSVFTVTLMAVLWTGYLVLAKAEELDSARSPRGDATAQPRSERSKEQTERSKQW